VLAPLNHAPTRQAVDAERAFLTGLGGGCAVPIAAHATVEGAQLHLRGRVTATDGSRQVHVELAGPMDDAAGLGSRLAEKALAEGAAQLLHSERA
jgi:hydroxymethylbilane synthase